MKRFDGADEDPKTVAGLRHDAAPAGPSRVVPGLDEAFGVGHQAEDPAGGIANARDGPG